MIVGLGMDLVEIARIEKAMVRPGFIERILTPAERAIYSFPHQVAGRWAAKEAVFKALGLPLTWQQIEILPDELGAPRVQIDHPDFLPGRMRCHVTITHERTHAAAVAIVERMVYQAPSL